MTKAKCKRYDLSGNEEGEIEIEYGEKTEVNSQLIKDYIVALRANARQWSANTITRSEANCSGAKPHRQKGTGKARQGSLCSPQYKGGYRVHAPKPKFDQHVRINKKERRAAIRAILVEKMIAGDLIFLKDDFESNFSGPKTKVVKQFLKSVAGDVKRVACIWNGDGERLKDLKLGMRNIPYASIFPARNVNGYDAAVNQKIIVIDSAKDELEAILRG